MENKKQKYFLPYQIKWIEDRSPLRIIQKSRQAGITYADSFHSVELASRRGARHDVYISIGTSAMMGEPNWYLHSHVRWMFNAGGGHIAGGPHDGNVVLFQTRVGVDF